MITVSGLKKYYGTGSNIVRALDGIDMEIGAGEFVAVIGMSGSGKSTLLHMVGGLDRPTQGRVADKNLVDKILNLLKLEDRRDALPNRLSGGQRQRVAIARALVAKPSVLLADEPTGSLDRKTGQAVMELLKWTSRKFNQTILMITHDGRIAEMADRIVSMEDGRIKGGGGNEGQ